MLPVERMRRFVTPIDINGTGRVQTWGGGTHDFGPDNFGRVQFFSYFRPAGVAGPINVSESTAHLPLRRHRASSRVVPPASVERAGTPRLACRRPGPRARPTCPT